MKESDKIKFWLGVSVAAFFARHVILHYRNKTQDSERQLGTIENKQASIVDVRAAPGVARVTL